MTVSTDAWLGLFIKQLIAEDALDHFYESKKLSLSRPNGETCVHVITWTRDYNGNFSGVINGKIASVNPGARTLEPLIKSTITNVIDSNNHENNKIEIQKRLKEMIIKK